jgi:hypothetical protein
MRRLKAYGRHETQLRNRIVDLPALEAFIILAVAKHRLAAVEPELGTQLLAALCQAHREQHLDVADAILRAIELYDTDRRYLIAAYRIIADAATSALRPPSSHPRNH